MKLIDKLKNALFEEEYVEVEEKPKKKQIKKEPKVIKKEPIKEKEEKPIAKKIVPPERKEVKIHHHEDQEIESNYEGESLATEKIEKKEYKFPLVSDNEFKEQKLVEQPRQKEKQKKSFKEEPIYEEPKQKEQKKSKAYGIDDLELPETMHGAYEKKEERTYFKPSPIISPIYGILDKNYKKEEIIPKREVRLTSTYARENLDLDEVRERAFGSNKEDIIKGPDLEQYEIEEESNFRDNDLLDLREDKPEVKKVTVGDAEEYFEDLGLEYNVDYKDLSKETRVGRRHQEELEDEGPKIIEEEKVERKTTTEITMKEEVVEEAPKKMPEDTDEDNLFDLIDSMYEKE